MQIFVTAKLTLQAMVRMNLHNEIGGDYYKFGVMILDDDYGNKTDAIVHTNNGNVEMICIKILQRWLKGGGRQPVTLLTLVQVLREINLHSLATDIERKI